MRIYIIINKHGDKKGWIKVVILGESEGNIVDIRVETEDLVEQKSGRLSIFSAV